MNNCCMKCGTEITHETTKEGTTGICRTCHEALGKIKVHLTLGIFLVLAGVFFCASISQYAPGVLQLGPAWSEFKQKDLPVISGLWQSGGFRALQAFFVILAFAVPFLFLPVAIFLLPTVGLVLVILGVMERRGLKKRIALRQQEPGNGVHPREGQS